MSIIKTITRILIARILWKTPLSILLLLLAVFFYFSLSLATNAQELKLFSADLIDEKSIIEKQTEIVQTKGEYEQTLYEPELNYFTNVYESPQGVGYSIVYVDKKTGIVTSKGFGPLAEQYTYTYEVPALLSSTSTVTELR